MSIKDSLKRGLNAVTDKITNAREYRTSVLNDFSFVQKAYFYVYEKDGPYASANEHQYPDGFAYKEFFPVQINPNTLSLNYGSNKLPGVNVSLAQQDEGASGGFPIISPRNRYSTGSLQISLEYNIYDEYNARTMNGSIPQNNISLHTGNHTSLEKLRNLAGTDRYVLFKWGEIQYFGALQSVNITYNVFSPWGEPLAANATIDIAHQPLAFHDSGIEKGIEIDPLNCPQLKKMDITDKLKIEKQEKATTAGLLASNAMR